MFTYHIEGQFRFMFRYCTFRPNKYISVSWTLSDLLWAPANTFLFNFPIMNYYFQKGKISNSFLAKTTCVIRKVIKNYM